MRAQVWSAVSVLWRVHGVPLGLLLCPVHALIVAHEACEKVPHTRGSHAQTVQPRQHTFATVVSQHKDQTWV